MPISKGFERYQCWSADNFTKLFFEPGATNSPQIVCLKSVQKKNKSAIVLLIEQKIPIFLQIGKEQGVN